jgi:hypothetical protein
VARITENKRVVFVGKSLGDVLGAADQDVEEGKMFVAYADDENGFSSGNHAELGRFTVLSLLGVAVLWTVYYVGREAAFLSTVQRSVVSLLAVGLLVLSTRHVIQQVYQVPKIKRLVGAGAFFIILSESGRLLRKVALVQDVPLTHWFTTSMAHMAAVAQYTGILFLFASFFLCIFQTEAAKRRLAQETRDLAREIEERKRAEEEREKTIIELREALENIKTLRGIIPICAGCKKVRDDQGYWHQVEAYVRDHSDAEFSHGLCIECAKEFYPEEAAEILSTGEDKDI